MICKEQIFCSFFCVKEIGEPEKSRDQTRRTRNVFEVCARQKGNDPKQDALQRIAHFSFVKKSADVGEQEYQHEYDAPKIVARSVKPKIDLAEIRRCEKQGSKQQPKHRQAAALFDAADTKDQEQLTDKHRCIDNVKDPCG